MMMNKKQKKCIWTGLIVFVLMGLFPPWVSMDESHHLFSEPSYTGAALYSSSGYSFLLTPPRSAAWLDLTRLIAQWIMVVVITAWFFYLKSGAEAKK